MARRTTSEYRDLARDSAWRQLGRRHYGWYVGWEIARRIALPVMVLVVVVGLGWWVVDWFGSNSASNPLPPGALDSVAAGPWGWVLFAISATTAAALLAYRYYYPERPGRAPVVLAVALLLFCAVLVMWIRG